jgi:hypothetical protein
MTKLKFILSLTFAILLSIFLGAVAEGVGANGIAVAFTAFAATVVISISMDRNIAYMACGLISLNQTATCATKPQAGSEPAFWIANRDDIDSYTYAVGNEMIITAITMKAGKKFFKYTGLKRHLKPKAEMVEGTYYNFWKHIIEFLAFSNDGAFLKELDEGIVPGNFVIIAKHKWLGTAGAYGFEAYGCDSGLVCKNGTERDPNSSDTQGAWKIKLETENGESEPRPPRKVFDTDVATVEAMLALITTP